MSGSVNKDGKKWYYVLEAYENGKRKQYKKRGFATKREANTALVKAQNELNNGTYVKSSSLLMSEYLLQWMKDKQYSIGHQTAQINNSYVRTHIIPIIGDIPLSKITAYDIQKFTSTLLDNGLATSTVRRIFNIINTALNKAEKLQLIQTNVAALIDKPKVKRKEIHVWDVHEVTQFLEIAASNKYYHAFLLAVMTGMRQGEILGLRWQDVDFLNKKVFIRQTLSHDGKHFNTGAKTASGIRSISLDDHTIQQLEQQYKYYNVVSREYVFQKNLVVCTNTGNQFFPRDLKKIFDRLILKAGLRKITFHDLRHTHASLLLKQNVHPKIVSERLGHASIQMTLDTYSHLMPNMQHEVAENLFNLLFKENQTNVTRT
ncbi:tyrosine-type recombinase/integrase [Paenibacillus sp. GCM10012307]|uniref:Tyrosine-type recombinase/integrase n=1 Tax=Paenibacillus roseus TaxID=2798579 RepID=A0A934MQE8_9BACL|nr:site-specific integrase [Paenibacillus roseus]MBJ6361314.1 tyrosine-type recombinase/integrase [Paenibacillus roseus]